MIALACATVLLAFLSEARASFNWVPARLNPRSFLRPDRLQHPVTQLRPTRPVPMHLSIRSLSSTFCCCFVQKRLWLPLIRFSSDVRAHLSVTVSLAISIAHQELMIWPPLFESFHDPRSTQRVLRSSCWALTVLTSAAQASHGSRLEGNLW